jgi:hypothetical protein
MEKKKRRLSVVTQPSPPPSPLTPTAAEEAGFPLCLSEAAEHDVPAVLSGYGSLASSSVCRTDPVPASRAVTKAGWTAKRRRREPLSLLTGGDEGEERQQEAEVMHGAEDSGRQMQRRQDEDGATALLQLLDRLSSEPMAEDSDSSVLRAAQLSRAASRDEELLSGLQAFGL